MLTEDLDMRKVCIKWFQRSSPKHKSKEEFLTTKQITVLEHPAYSQDLAPTDSFLFTKIKEILKERHFDDNDDIRSNTTADLKVIPQNHFQNCLKGGLGAGIGVQLPKRSTLKATTVVFSNDVALLPRLVRELYCKLTY